MTNEETAGHSADGKAVASKTADGQRHMSAAEIRADRRRRLPPLAIEVSGTPTLEVRSVEVDGDGTRTMLVTDRASGASLLVDPSGDRARVLELVYDAQEAAEDAGTPLPRLEGIVLTHRDREAAETVARVRRRLGAPVLAGALPAASDAAGSNNTDPIRADREVTAGETLALGTSTARILPMHGYAADGIALAIDGAERATGAKDAAATTHVFVGDALTESGPPAIRRNRPAAMALIMNLERGLLAGHPDDTTVWRRAAPPITVGELQDASTQWRRGYGLPASTDASPVWFTPDGSTLRLRRVNGEPDHPEHRFIMLMIGASVQGVADPDDPFAFYAPAGVFPPVAALLGLEPASASSSPEPMRALHLGAGLLVVLRMIDAARPGSAHVAVDAEPTVVDFVRTFVPLAPSTDLEVLGGDARQRVDALGAERREPFDVVVVDVFDRLRTPPSITSVEAFASMSSVLTPDGTVVVNLIADPDSDSAQTVVAAMREVFAHVVVAGPTPVAEGRAFGNVVAAGSDARIETADVVRRLRGDETPHTVLADDDGSLATWLGDAANRPIRDSDADADADADANADANADADARTGPGASSANDAR